MVPLLLFRIDGDARTGTGHVMRSLALADSWLEQGGRVAVASSVLTPALEERILAEGIDLYELNVSPGSGEDALATSSIATRSEACWILADGYAFGDVFQHVVKAQGHRLFLVDDYGHAEFYSADLVHNQNAYASASDYESRKSTARLLLGCDYVLLREEFRNHPPEERGFRNVARRILVTLGGSDPDNIGAKILSALASVEVDDMEVSFIFGGSNPHGTELERILRHAPFPVHLAVNSAEMRGHMVWAELAVAAGGTTSYELSYMGLPSLLLELADNQKRVVEGMVERGVALSLGRASDLATASLAKALTDLMHSPDCRRRLSERGRLLVDGKGCQRVLQGLELGRIYLRPAVDDDCRSIWAWANDPDVRNASFSSDLIPREDHDRWYLSKLNDMACVFLVSEDETGELTGQVRFDLDGHEATISAAMSPESRGKGQGAHLIERATRRVMRERNLSSVHAYIKPENARSAHAFAKAGYHKHGCARVKGQDALHYVWRG